MKKELKYLLLSDIHLGHDVNDTATIIRHLDWFFNNYKDRLMTIDLIILAGDIFDKLLSSNSKDLRLIFNWLSRLMIFCKSYNITIRALEGTPGHDFRQLRLFDSVLSTLNLDNLDYKYIDTLTIEYIEKFDRYFLYLPDEYASNSEECFKLVKDKLKEYNLEKVDIVIMHGAFRYQIPMIESPHFHKEEDYLSITNETINVGHIHYHSQFEKILVPGSFDRLSHSDDDTTKGALLVTTTPKEFSYIFLENKKASIFITIDITNMELEDIDKELKKYNNKYSKSFIRLLTKKENDKIVFTINSFKEKYTNMY